MERMISDGPRIIIGRGCSKERIRSAVIKMIEAKFKLELLTQKSFYDVIEEPLKVKIMGEKLRNFVIFSSKKCDVFDFKSVTV